VRPDSEAPPEAVLVLTTLGASQRRRLRERRGRSVVEAEPETVPTARATLVRPEPFSSADEAGRWLSELRGDRERAAAELGRAMRTLNRALHAQRLAALDPYVPALSAEQALVRRIGYGGGEQVADGRFAEAWELPGDGPRAKRSMAAPDERFAAILGGRATPWACEELILRARLDLDAGRDREAALQARVALEGLLAELASEAPGRAELEGDRPTVGQAANAALNGPLPESLLAGLEACVRRMEAALRRRRLKG
jgi:hypothetical protein